MISWEFLPHVQWLTQLLLTTLSTSYIPFLYLVSSMVCFDLLPGLQSLKKVVVLIVLIKLTIN